MGWLGSRKKEKNSPGGSDQRPICLVKGPASQSSQLGASGESSQWPPPTAPPQNTASDLEARWMGAGYDHLLNSSPPQLTLSIALCELANSYFESNPDTTELNLSDPNRIPIAPAVSLLCSLLPRGEKPPSFFKAKGFVGVHCNNIAILCSVWLCYLYKRRVRLYPADMN